MTTKHCKDCRFVAPVIEAGNKPSKETGYCYRFPPQVIAADQSGYPPVKLDIWWCGEFEQRPPADEATTAKRKNR